eukprot:gene9073-1168_t
MIKSIYKEIKSINKSSIWEDQAEIEFFNEENPFELRVLLKPKYGYFVNTIVKFKLVLPKEKSEKPNIKCLDKIFHPNINFDGKICFSMFSDEWSEGYTIEHYINGLLWLLSNPNHDSCLNTECNEKSVSNFKTKVLLSSFGSVLNKTKYSKISTIPLELGDLEVMDFSKISKSKYTHHSSKVLRFSKYLNTDTFSVLKSIVLECDDYKMLIMSNGNFEIDLDDLASILKVKEVRFKKLPNIKSVCPFFESSLYVKVFYNESIFEIKEKHIFVESGIDKVYFRIALDSLKKIIPKESIFPIKTVERKKEPIFPKTVQYKK